MSMLRDYKSSNDILNQLIKNNSTFMINSLQMRAFNNIFLNQYYSTEKDLLDYIGNQKAKHNYRELFLLSYCFA